MATTVVKSISAAPAWAGSTAYTVGQYRKNGTHVYVVVTGGTSASSGGPTGTGSGITDGGVTWDWVLTPDYATIQAWADAIPANLITADELWRGECYNHGEFVITTAQTVGSGRTMDGTRYIHLKCATGHSFADHAGKLTNALRYDASKGVAIRTVTAVPAHIMLAIHGGTTQIEGLQVKKDNNDGLTPVTLAASVTARNMLVETIGSGGGIGTANGCKVINCLVIDRHSTSGAGGAFGCATALFANCTAVRPSDLAAGGSGFVRQASSDPTAKNCASFGFATGFVNPTLFNAASTANATDGAAAPGSIILGAVLIGVSFIPALNVAVFSGFSATYSSLAFSLGASMVLGGVSQLIAGNPAAPAPAERPNNLPSYAFNGPVNTTAQGNPVPILYGRMRVGSQVISTGLSTVQI